MIDKKKNVSTPKDRKEFVKVKSFKRQLSVRLTPVEFHSYSREMARLTKDLAIKEEEKGSVAATYADEIKKMKLSIGILVRKISDEAEHREISCQWEMDFVEGHKRLVRMDTGEVIDSGDITDSDRQETFELE